MEALCSLCEVNASDFGGMTAFAHASQRGHDSVVRVLMRSVYFDLDKELRNECIFLNSALSLAAETGYVNIVRFLLENDFIVQMVMEQSPDLPWLPIEEVVFGHYYRRSHSLRTAKVIVGTMATSLPTLRRMAITGHPKVPLLSFAQKGRLLKHKARELRTLDIFLRAAAEVGHIDAIQHLLELRKTEQYRKQNADATMDMSSYVRDRAIGPDTVMEVLGIDVDCWSLENPAERIHLLIPMFLAAVRQHEEALALLVSGHRSKHHVSVQDMMTRARGIHLGCNGFEGVPETWS